ncbi:lipase 3-like [Galleria mellonella]|uniref:Lipase 3-like n=1 Tax=Galleria mellonella TaxID=7137 RepID=A0A6J1WTA4_GALME|nr:lipase 3-like [Galleria mellonella]
MWSRFLLVFYSVVCSLCLPAGRDRPIFTIYEIPEWIRYEGYVAERHHVTTHDGYILEMHRIPYGQHQTTSATRRPVVFMMHGLMVASNSYIALGSQRGVAYNFADAGFDVWLGNARGNTLSRRHVTLDPDDSEDKSQFFDFSFEEIGMYDVAQMIDYVLNYTGNEKLHYIGHSQGGTAFLVLASMKPEYNEKFTSVHLLAGVGYQEYFPNSALRTLATFTNVIYAAALGLGIVEVDSPLSFNRTTDDSADYSLPDICDDNAEQEFLCDLETITKLIRDDVIEEDIMGSMFGGAALKQIAHYGQNIRDKSFRRWNYGAIRNREIYGSTSPPIYNISLITANVTMHYTVNDNLLDERDVLAMANDMPNTVVRRVARDDFLHADFVAAFDAKDLVTDYIIESMLQLQDIEYIESEEDDSENIDDSTESEDITDPNKPDSSSIIVLSLMIKIYLSIYALWVIV